MRVHDVMIPEAVACQAEADIGAAARLMLEGRFGSLPVVDRQGKVVGVVTDRDIAMAAAVRRRNTSHIAVHEAMSPRVHGCLAYDEIRSALKEMAEVGVRRLPVLDANGHLAGILSMDDILLRAVDVEGGLTSQEFVEALRRICSRPPVEPEIDLGDVYVSG